MTTELMKKIELMLPIANYENHIRRRAAMALASGDKLRRNELYDAAGNSQQARAAIVSWDGIRWLSQHPDLQLNSDECVLAPWVRRALDLPVSNEEVLADLRRDPLEKVRGWLARCRNVYTVDEALQHAYPELTAVGLAG